MSSAVPVKVGKYENLEELGRGSMGVVYSAYDPFADRNVAIKLVHSEALNNAKTGARFKRLFFTEVHAASVLNHPNILKVHDANIEGDHYYLVMDLIPEANTLADYCKADTLLPLRDVVGIIYTCAKALDYAHRQGIIHRDIKPRNIMQTRTRDIKIADFSVALIDRDDYMETQIGGLMGSPIYMSPEQITDGDISNNTDIFSLGVLMYELLTGRHPFKSDNFNTITKNITREAPAPLSAFRNDIPERLALILQRMLHKESAQRYSMGLDLASDLALIFEDLEEVDNEDVLRQKFDVIKQLRFFQTFTDVDIWELMRACDWRKYKKGDYIIQEGDEDHSFYILLSGIVSVEKNSLHIDHLQAGDCFGEMGYLTKAKRTASVKANADVSLIQVNASTLDRASESMQLRFLKVFVKTLVARLTDTTSELARA
jgi:eukaryotic-like serine/threonine-protein kinase